MIEDFDRNLTSAVDAEASREDRAQVCAELVRAARGYRWVGIYDVGDDESVLFGWAGAMAPAQRRASVQILGAESGIVIGTLDAESDRADAFTQDDVAFLERCAAILRPLYD